MQNVHILKNVYYSPLEIFQSIDQIHIQAVGFDLISHNDPFGGVPLCCIQGLLSMWIIETIEWNNSSGAVTLHHVYEAPAHMYKLVQKHFRKSLQEKSLVMHNLLLAAHSNGSSIVVFFWFFFPKIKQCCIMLPSVFLPAFFSPCIRHQRQNNCSGRSHTVCSVCAGGFSDNHRESPCYKHPFYESILNSVKKPQTHS